MQLTANKPGSLSFEASLKSAHEGLDGRNLARRYHDNDRPVEDSAIRFQARLLVNTEGGKRTERDGKIVITGADSATLILSGATNFENYKDVSADPQSAQRRQCSPPSGGKSFEALRAEHVADYQRLFRRVSLDLGARPPPSFPPTSASRPSPRAGDPALVALLFQYGRYLMIASSRPGGQPANLQGLWNDSNNPPWDSKYTVNINTEMNYWPAEVTNLSECQLPLFDALKDLAVTGAITAKEHYNARGWVLHHNFDLWRGTAPINASNHGIWQTGGAWLSHASLGALPVHRRPAFLRDTAYPLMKGAALFFVDSLVKDPKTGYLITGPSNSPEQGGLVMGPTMDRQIVRALFGDDDRGGADPRRGCRAARPAGRHARADRAQPDRASTANCRSGWKTWTTRRTHHRHVSHLWGVYPGLGDHAVRHAGPVQGGAASR